jgi:hypothetical protein
MAFVVCLSTYPAVSMPLHLFYMTFPLLFSFVVIDCVYFFSSFDLVFDDTTHKYNWHTYILAASVFLEF